MNTMFRRTAIVLLLFVLSVNVYRAWTQSITSDEAWTYQLFLSGPASQLLDSYDACHHVLHTILCKVSISWFGLSKFTLRIPSLLGGLLYLLTFHRLSMHLFGEGRLFLLSVALLSLNPLVMDHMSAARGYGLALALLLWSLHQMLVYVDGQNIAPGNFDFYILLGNDTSLVEKRRLAVLYSESASGAWLAARGSPATP